ncbi:MAG: Beta-barrel assembly-enhancing protease [Stenotrophomonas maltophilia]|nr:MAG: Beta-barrel assembly-enhancing protease [Stenotrophomonas maltophilia]
MISTGDFMEQARRRMALGQMEGAIESLCSALASDPEHTEAHALLALCLLSQRRLHAAAREAQLALANDPMSFLGHYSSASVAMAQRQFKRAERHILQLLELDPGSARVRCMQASLYELTGRRAQVLPTLQQALSLAPEDPEVLAELADAYRLQGDLGAAEQYATQALRLRPGYRAAIVVMGHVHLRRGELREARHHALWALSDDANDVHALFLLSAIKARANPLLGLWWRYNSWMAELGPTRSMVVLLVMFVVYRVAVISCAATGHPLLAQGIDWAWLGLVIYTFIGPQIFRQSLEKERAKVRLSRDF